MHLQNRQPITKPSPITTAASITQPSHPAPYSPTTNSSQTMATIKITTKLQTARAFAIHHHHGQRREQTEKEKKEKLLPLPKFFTFKSHGSHHFTVSPCLLCLIHQITDLSFPNQPVLKHFSLASPCFPKPKPTQQALPPFPQPQQSIRPQPTSSAHFNADINHQFKNTTVPILDRRLTYNHKVVSPTAQRSPNHLHCHQPCPLHRWRRTKLSVVSPCSIRVSLPSKHRSLATDPGHALQTAASNLINSPRPHLPRTREAKQSPRSSTAVKPATQLETTRPKEMKER